MSEEELLLQLARLLTRREDSTTAEARRLLLELVLRLRALLATIPAEGQIARTIRYNQLRPQILSLLQNFTNAYYGSIRLNLPTLDAALRLIYSRLFSLDQPLPPTPLQDLLQTTSVLTRPTATLLAPGPTGISPFTLQLERLLDTSARAAIFRDAPRPELLDLITPPNARTITKGTVANALLGRVTATTAAIYWSLVTPTASSAAAASPAPPRGWRWNAVLDPETCPVCRPLHNTVAPSLDAFPYGPPPLHPFCRCIPIPLFA